MPFSLVETNLEPNQQYFCRIENADSTTFRVRLFNTLADAQASSNIVASAIANYGSDVQMTLVDEATDPVVSRFNLDLTYHLRVGAPGVSSMVIISFGPYTDLPEISDPLIITEQMVRDRVILEINRGTHVAYQHALSLPEHRRTLEEGSIVSLSSASRSWSGLARVESHRIVCRVSEDSVYLISEITAVEYKDLKKEV